MDRAAGKQHIRILLIRSISLSLAGMGNPDPLNSLHLFACINIKFFSHFNKRKYIYAFQSTHFRAPHFQLAISGYLIFRLGVKSNPYVTELCRTRSTLSFSYPTVRTVFCHTEVHPGLHAYIIYRIKFSYLPVLTSLPGML